jgi:hypothetical protein
MASQNTTSAKGKSKKQHSKKEAVHEIPVAKTAKGRRPHTEETVEPYQPSLLSESDLEPQRAAAAADVQEESVAEEVEVTAAASEEVVIEGEPAPKAKRTNVDIQEQFENVKGAVQMGTAIVKSSFPKPFEIAEKVVEDWKQDGDFSELPINQPLVQFYLGLGLRKAKQTEKDLEKKLESAGVLPVVRQQWQKAQKLFK